MRDRPAAARAPAEAVAGLLEEGFLVNDTSARTVRFLPPAGDRRGGPRRPRGGAAAGCCRRWWRRDEPPGGRRRARRGVARPDRGRRRDGPGQPAPVPRLPAGHARAGAADRHGQGRSSPETASRLVAGRPIDIEYDDPNGVVAVQETIGPPGTIFDHGVADGDPITLTLPAPGAVTMTAKYFVNSSNPGCAYSFSYTLQRRGGRPRPRRHRGDARVQPRAGATTSRSCRASATSTAWPPRRASPSAAAGRRRVVPLTALLHIGAQPAQAPFGVVTDPAVGRGRPVRHEVASGLGPGRAAVVREHGSPYPNEGDRFLAAEILTKKPTPLLGSRSSQGTRAVGSLRFYTAWKPAERPLPQGVGHGHRGRLRARALQAPAALHRARVPWLAAPAMREIVTG